MGYLCPILDGPQCDLKVSLVGHKLQDLGRHAVAIDGHDAFRIMCRQLHCLETAQVQLRPDARTGELTKDEVNGDASQGELDDGHKAASTSRGGERGGEAGVC